MLFNVYMKAADFHKNYILVRLKVYGELKMMAAFKTGEVNGLRIRGE